MTDTATLYPLRQSFDEDEVEAQLKALFIHLYDTFILAPATDLNLYGMAHLGVFPLVQRFVRADGLPMVNNDDETSMRYLYRAWHSSNRERGLHFLRTYLQMLWPNQFELNQMWYSSTNTASYPVGAVAFGSIDSVDGYFLTSRITIGVESIDETLENLLRIVIALRTVVSARFLLRCSFLRRTQCTIRMASVATASLLCNIESDGGEIPIADIMRSGSVATASYVSIVDFS